MKVSILLFHTSVVLPLEKLCLIAVVEPEPGAVSVHGRRQLLRGVPRSLPERLGVWADLGNALLEYEIVTSCLY